MLPDLWRHHFDLCLPVHVAGIVCVSVRLSAPLPSLARTSVIGFSTYLGNPEEFILRSLPKFHLQRTLFPHKDTVIGSEGHAVNIIFWRPSFELVKCALW